MKFDVDGVPRLIFGSIGQGDGQLYYPQGIAVGQHRSGETWLYVVEGNNRVTVFDDSGNYIGKFGDTGEGQLDTASSTFFLPNVQAPGGLVIVGNTRLHRITIFDDTGAFQRNFQCGSCPFGGIRPLGVAARWQDDDGKRLQIYAVDEFTNQVQVLNSRGNWVRSIGEYGTAPGQLQGPDDIAADDEGNVYVTNAGFALGSTERVSKFNRAGEFQFFFNSTGATTFVSPHGLALDGQGKIYVVSGYDVFRFREEPPKLFFHLDHEAASWIDTQGAWFQVSYNGLEQTCRGHGEAQILVPLAQKHQKVQRRFRPCHHYACTGND